MTKMNTFCNNHLTKILLTLITVLDITMMETNPGIITITLWLSYGLYRTFFNDKL